MSAVTKAIWLIENRYLRDPTLDDIAGHAGVSRSHISRTLGGNPDLVEYYGPGFDPEAGIGDVEIWLPVKA